MSSELQKTTRNNQQTSPDFSSALQSIVAKIQIEYNDIEIETEKEFIKKYRIKLIKTLQKNQEKFLSKSLPIAENWIDNQTNYSLRKEILKQAAEKTALDAFKYFIKQLETFEIPQEIIAEWQQLKKLNTKPVREEFFALQKNSLTLVLEANKDTTIATNPIIRTLNKSLNSGSPKESWQKDSKNLAYYCEEYPNNSYVTITLQNDAGIFLWDEAIKILEKQGAESALLNIYLTGQLFARQGNITEKLTLDAETILKDLGWNKRKRSSQSEKLKKIYDLAFMLSCFRTRYEINTRLRGNKNLVTFADEGNAWHIRFKSIGEKSLFSDSASSIRDDKLYKLWLEITPGAWVDHFLNLQKASNYPEEGLYQYGYMCAQITKIDPVHDELALRIALHIATENTINSSGLYKVRDLLRTRYSETQLKVATNDPDAKQKRRASEKIRNQWKTAIERLHELGWQIKADSQSYPNWLRPNCLQDEGYLVDNKKRKNIINNLLSAKIEILQPFPIPEKLQEISQLPSQKTQATPKREKNCLTPQQIRDARKKKGYTTRQLAGRLNISPSTISEYENGSKKPTPKREKSLRQILKINNKHLDNIDEA